jgi:hypothetical protein
MTIRNAEEVMAALAMPFQISYREIQISIFADCRIFSKPIPQRLTLNY